MAYKTVVTGYARTPIGSFLGSLRTLSAPKLGAAAIKAALQKSNIDSVKVDEVIMGQVLSAGVGQAPARQASLAAGLSENIPCTTVNKICGSGLKSVMMACQSIFLGESSIVVAGGMESMSQAPYLLPDSRGGMRMGNKQVIDSMINDGLWDPYSNAHMGKFGDLCAKKYGFSREQQDSFAKASYERALAAIEQGIFAKEIVPITIEGRKGNTVVESDEEPAQFNPVKMPTLRAAFGKDGTITAANASKINDGGTALVLMNTDSAVREGIKPIAEILSYATFAHEPAWFTTAPVFSIKKACEKAGVSVADIDLFEINEAFSVVPMVVMSELEIPHKQVNILGGAVALGHPIGCSGARILCTLLTAMQEKNVSLGCASICLGGGGALSMIMKR